MLQGILSRVSTICTALFVAVFLMVSVTGCTSNEATNDEESEEMEEGSVSYTPSDEAIASQEDLDVYDIADAVDQNGNRYIIGKVRSKSQKPYTYVELNFTLHDDSQNTLGRVIGNTTTLKAGDVWEFQIEVPIAEATQYRLERTFGW
jgi:hypothetical protein